MSGSFASYVRSPRCCRSGIGRLPRRALQLIGHACSRFRSLISGLASRTREARKPPLGRGTAHHPDRMNTRTRRDRTARDRSSCLRYCPRLARWRLRLPVRAAKGAEGLAADSAGASPARARIAAAGLVVKVLSEKAWPVRWGRRDGRTFAEQTRRPCVRVEAAHQEITREDEPRAKFESRRQ